MLLSRGLDTTSTTLTYLFWELTRLPEWQSRLHEELSSQKEWVNGIPSYNEVKDLPVLEAVIEEALRLHPAAPASLPRETPQGGRVLNGVMVPEKVRHLSSRLGFELISCFLGRPLYRHSAIRRNVTRPFSPTPMHFSLSGGWNLGK